jgi:hypothetical protein
MRQVTPFSELEPSASATVQVGVAAVRLVEVTTLPLPSTATQRALLRQDTPFSRVRK